MPTPLPDNVRLKLLPPADAVRVLQDRQLLQPTFSWADMWQEEHTRAFTVAKMMRTDLLQTVYDQVQRALTEGRTFEQFARDLEPSLKRAGWWGKKVVTDPVTGERVEAQLGSLRRLETIYDVNMRGSYAAGTWARAVRGRRVNPLLVYRTMRDLRVRPLHRKWDGLALPIDDSWWNAHYPPNGWKCRCRAYATNDEGLQQLEKSGVKIKHDAPADRFVKWTNKRTGEITRVPLGIDPGFAFNPGKVSRIGQLAELEAQSRDALAVKIREVAKLLDRPLPIPAAPAGGLQELDQLIEAGREIFDRQWQQLGGVNLSQVTKWRDQVVTELQSARSFRTTAKVASRGEGANYVKRASLLYPDDWTREADGLGKLYVKGTQNGRGFAWTATAQHADRPVRLGPFGLIDPKAGDGYIFTDLADLATAIHEYGHRLQSAMPGMDALFQALHRRRTQGEAIRSLRELTGNPFDPRERARPDKYVTPYQGKEYGVAGDGEGQALEVLTIAFEYFLGPRSRELRNLVERDPEMVHLVIGLLRHYKP